MRGCDYTVFTWWCGRYDRFVGRVTQLTKHRAELLVLDPGPPPRVTNKCPYPECIRSEHGAGDHEFPRIREGALIGVVLKYTEFEAQVSERAVSRNTLDRALQGAREGNKPAREVQKERDEH